MFEYNLQKLVKKGLLRKMMQPNKIVPYEGSVVVTYKVIYITTI